MEETKHLAEKIATYANVGTLITLKGDLGAEKQPSQKHLVRHLEFKKQSIHQPLQF